MSRGRLRICGSIGLPYILNTRLVRGLDYYSHTVFEFVSTNLGSQGTVLGGGSYDGLMETMGGPSIPGVGFGSGVERLSMLLEDLPALPDTIVMMAADEEAEYIVQQLTARIRDAGNVVDMTYSGNMKKRFKRADKINARFAVIVGSDELASKQATVKDLSNGAQSQISFDQLAEYFKNNT